MTSTAAELIAEARAEAPSPDPSDYPYNLIVRLADALEEAHRKHPHTVDGECLGVDMRDYVPRVVSTVAELDALPAETVIRTPQNYTLERLSDGWWRAGVNQAYPLGNRLMVPATVLWVGGTE